jgi:uncharacterized protein (TIGR03437 family)
VNPANLPAGDYYARVTIESHGAANSPQVVSVVLSVAPKGTASIDVRPTGLIFVGLPNSQVAPEQIIVTNTGDSTTSFRSTRDVGAGAPFFSYQPTNGSLPPGQPVPISVQPNLQGLAAGVRRGSITLQFADGSTRIVAILLVVPGSTSTPAAEQASPAATACKPSTLNLVFVALGQGFQVRASFPAEIAVKVVDDCGAFLNTGSVVTSFSNGDPLLSLVPVGNGEWTGTWQPGGAVARIQITATASNPDNSLRGSVQISGDSASNPAIPVISSGSVVNSASQRARAPIAPGGIITIYGQNLSSGVAESGVPREKSLNGTSALIGGAAPPLIYVSGSQVNAIVPYEIPINTNLQLLVQSQGALTLPVPLVIAPAQPAVFTADGSGTGQGYVYSSTGIRADRNHPVKSGDTVVVYCAGLGMVNPPVPAGYPAPANPLSHTANPVTATIGGIPAHVAFAGLTPRLTGLYQVNVVVPALVPPGDAIDLVLTVAGQISPPVTFTVH